MYLPAANTLGFSTNGTEKVKITSAGNLGLGVTPSAWKSNFKALMVNTQGAAISGRSDNQSLNLSTNWYEDSGGEDRYINSDFASRYLQFAGSHRWFNAPSGTAGNAITFTTAGTGRNFIGEVPAPIKSWMLLRIGSLFESREETAPSARTTIEYLPFVDGLLYQYRVLGV